MFTRAKHGANHLTGQLNKDGICSAAIHGNKSQGVRACALVDFKSDSTRVLVATDIATHDLDIEELPHVVDYELSSVPEDYVRRIRRTSRAAATGGALSLVCVDEHRLLYGIEELLKKEIPRIAIPGYEPGPSIRAEPIQNGRQQRGGSRGRGGGRGQQQPRRVENSAKSDSAKPTEKPSHRLGDAKSTDGQQRHRRPHKPAAAQ